jgi:hypothetical protein
MIRFYSINRKLPLYLLLLFWVFFIQCETENPSLSKAPESNTKTCVCTGSTACDSFGELTLSNGKQSVNARSANSEDPIHVSRLDTLYITATATQPACGYLTKLSLNLDVPSFCWNISEFTKQGNYTITRKVVVPANALPGNYLVSLMISTSEPTTGTYQQHKIYNLNYTITE